MQRDPMRVVAFSDAVFAITVTLLVLEIRPPADDRHLLHGLVALWPSYLAYAVSCLFIGQVWANHHVMFDHIRAADRIVVLLNTLLLMVVAFLPVATSVLAGALRSGHDQRTQSLRLRLLVAGTSTPLVLPVPASTGVDNPAVRRRSERISQRALGSLVDSVTELVDLGLVKSADVEIRTHSLGPQVKLYVLNNEEIFFGFYTVTEHPVTIDGEQVTLYDVRGKDSLLFHYSVRADDADGAEHVEQARTWFESIWSTIAREYQP